MAWEEEDCSGNVCAHWQWYFFLVLLASVSCLPRYILQQSGCPASYLNFDPSVGEGTEENECVIMELKEGPFNGTWTAVDCGEVTSVYCQHSKNVQATTQSASQGNTTSWRFFLRVLYKLSQKNSWWSWWWWNLTLSSNFHAQKTHNYFFKIFPNKTP